MSVDLIILDGPQAGRRLTVGASPAIIGRNPAAADIPFPLDNFISGRHVSVQADGRGVLFNDLRSTNGTFLNGERISQAVANVGDVVKIGSMTVRVTEAAAPAVPLAPPLAAWGSELTTDPFPPPAPPAPFDAPTPVYPSSAPPYAPAPPAAATAYALPPMSIPAPPPVPGVMSSATVPFPAQPFPEAVPFPPPLQEPIPVPSSPAPAERMSLSDSGSTKILSALNFSVPPPTPSPSAKALADARRKNEAVLENLREAPGPLFCLLNAGADETIPAMLAMADVNLSEHCLLEPSGSAPPRWAPYLLPLAPEAPLLRLLVEKGWGKGWANFFTSFTAFEELRAHFRKFLMVQVVNGGEPYFRFYEPAVLREFLHAGSAAELTMFFGPVDEWMLESENKGALLRASHGAEGLATTIVVLAEGAAASSGAGPA